MANHISLDSIRTTKVSSTIISEIDSTPNCVWDCHWLGKYTRQSPQSRPVLMTLNSTASVRNILFNRKSLPVGVSVKPDLAMEERKVESILLQERWRLIQSGMERKSIRLKGPCIFVNTCNRLHSKVLDSVLSFTLSQ